LCDIHSQALEGHIDLSGMKIVAPGHPVDTFRRENRELEKVMNQIEEMTERREGELTGPDADKYLNGLKMLFNSLMDVDKHYRRKENLLFPFLEKHGITGPPKVMWGKHDEIRDRLKNAINALNMPGEITPEIMGMKAELHLLPAIKGVADMIMKEEEILFPMTLDKLTEPEWYEIYRQTDEIGYCLYDPEVTWQPQGIDVQDKTSAEEGQISLPSGKFTSEELLAILNTLPVDITFVDRNDKVKYFSQGKERIFDRNRAILGRDVRMCHPPSSVHIVDQIVGDFRSGKADSAPFWIQMGGKFIHIEYFALRNERGEYLGTLEMSQDLTEKRKLAGDQRLLSYRIKEEKETNKTTMNTPSWLDQAKIRTSLDARPILAQGLHPLEQVQRDCAGLAAGEIYEIITPFPPAPMIEKMAAAGFEIHSETDTNGMVHTFFRRK
jgi:DUF438 domain-containing protein